MKYTATIEVEFNGEATCEKCRHQHGNDCGEEWCSLADMYLVNNEQDSDTCVCENVKLYSGLRPVWCPLVEVKE